MKRRSLQSLHEGRYLYVPHIVGLKKIVSNQEYGGVGRF